MVIASPPHTYLGLISVIAMFLQGSVIIFDHILQVNLLDDNVARPADNPQTLTLDHTTGSRSDE